MSKSRETVLDENVSGDRNLALKACRESLDMAGTSAWHECPLYVFNMQLYS